MSIWDVQNRESVLRAMAECDSTGRDQFLARYGFGRAKKYLVRGPNGQLYDSKAILGVAHAYEFPELPALRSSTFSGGELTVSRRLSKLGFEIVRMSQATELAISNRASLVVAELRRRDEMWHTVELAGGVLSAQEIRKLGIYGGAQGIWVAKAQTEELSDDGHGVAVALLHTGKHYADDLSEDGLIYHYPTTHRPRARDASEVAATKSARVLRLPIFVISRASKTSDLRRIQRGWIEDWDDVNRIFLVAFGIGQPAEAAQTPEAPFTLQDEHGRTKKSVERPTRPGQQRFKFHALQRYGAECAVCKVSIIEVLDAAHLCPKGDRGSDDARNSLILCATHHRALDAGHFAIDPDNLAICFRSDGPSAQLLRIECRDLSHMKKTPHKTALQWVWRRWQQSGA